MRKRWPARRLLTEHAFEVACEDAEIIEAMDLDAGEKELLLTIAWVRPLHVVVIVDRVHDEDRILTVYEPDPSRLSADFRTRR